VPPHTPPTFDGASRTHRTTLACALSWCTYSRSSAFARWWSRASRERGRSSALARCAVCEAWMVSFAPAAAGGNGARPGGIRCRGFAGARDDSQSAMGDLLSVAVWIGYDRWDDAAHHGVCSAVHAVRKPFCLAEPNDGDRHGTPQSSVRSGAGLPHRLCGWTVFVGCQLGSALRRRSNPV